MANNPKKVKDPTEVALSAIQEALNISDVPVEPNRSAVRNDAAAALTLVGPTRPAMIVIAGTGSISS